MTRIRILPDTVINKIAAGEVVERPASVLKELMENALDAGATRVDVSVRKGGKDLLRVSDNGHGMDRDDCLLAVQRHATSKLGKADDLQDIRSFGFRGEALSSIAAVSRFLLRSSAGNRGTCVEIEAGKNLRVREEGCPKGTLAEVRNLFFNVPARRRFLKTDRTEMSHVQDAFVAAALSRDRAGFRLSVDGKELMHFYRGEDLLGRIRRVLGRGFADRGIPVKAETGGWRMRGWVGIPEVARTSRTAQRWFVNGRPVHSSFLGFVLSDAFGSLIPSGRYPAGILFLECPEGQVDVNVHPAKKEIRFASRDTVRRFVSKTVTETLRKADIRPSVPLAAPMQEAPPEAVRLVRETATQHRPEEPLSQGLLFKGTGSTNEQASAASPVESLEALRIIGTVMDLYVLAESAKGLAIIDQHAAHERVLFEEALAEVARNGVEKQALLAPSVIEMSSVESDILTQNLTAFEEAGFEIREFGRNAVAITAVPGYFRGDDPRSLVLDLLDDLRAGRQSLTDFQRRDTIIRKACRSSVMARDRLQREELESLLRRLSYCRQPYTCPHGRPTVVLLRAEELARRFGREGSVRGRSL